MATNLQRAFSKSIFLHENSIQIQIQWNWFPRIPLTISQQLFKHWFGTISVINDKPWSKPMMA